MLKYKIVSLFSSSSFVLLTLASTSLLLFSKATQANTTSKLQSLYSDNQSLLDNTYNNLMLFENALVSQSSISYKRYYFSLASFLHSPLHGFVYKNKYTNTKADTVYNFAQLCRSLSTTALNDKYLNADATKSKRTSKDSKGRRVITTNKYPNWSIYCQPFKTLNRSFTSLDQFKSMLIYGSFLSYSSLRKGQTLSRQQKEYYNFLQQTMTRVQKKQNTTNTLGFAYQDMPKLATPAANSLVTQVNTQLNQRKLRITLVKK